MKIDGKTKVFAVFGQSTAHSMSPIIHNASFRNLGINCIFIGLSSPSDKLDIAFAGMQTLGIKGAAIILPYKVEAMKYCTDVDLMAKQIGAINTICFKDDERIIGYNTDAQGAAKAILNVSSIKDKNILMLGAGGAAKAIGFQMGVEKAKSLTIANKTFEKAFELSDQISDIFEHRIKTFATGISKEELTQTLFNTDILINTTSIGMNSNETIITADMLRQDMVVFDIVYTPYKTRLIQDAEKVGAKIVHGADMLIYQAMEQERIWLRVKPSFEVMKQYLMKQLNSDIRIKSV